MDTIAILDFGGQYTHLIANRIRRLGVYTEIVSSGTPAAQLRFCKGIVLSGGPHSVTNSVRPSFDPAVLALGIPVLGLCYGHQLIAQTLGGRVSRGRVREYGHATMTVRGQDPLLTGLSPREEVWMSHGDTVEELPAGFVVIGSTADCSTAAVSDPVRRVYGLQFHPEVTDTPGGMRILDNFLTICGAAREWNTGAFLREIGSSIRRTVGPRRVFMLVSGGVDSTVAFFLLNRELGPERVYGLLIDNGLMRREEPAQIVRCMREHGFDNLHLVDESERFLAGLDGVVDPEAKRKRIGRLFIDAQRRASAALGLNADDWLLGQGTIYPDTIESAGTEHADRIKTHHNRVDLVMDLLRRGLVIEPLRQLYKDEVREAGEALGLPRSLVWRHPFPGPGLGVRVLCSTGDDPPVDQQLQWQSKRLAADEGYEGTVLPVRTVGVQGDSRTYAYPLLVAGPLDWQRLERLSTRACNTLPGINRVVYCLHASGQRCYRLIRAFVTRERLELLRRFDHRATQVLVGHNQYDKIWQMPVILLPLLAGNGGQCVVVRPVISREAMTARFAPLDEDVLEGFREAARTTEGIGDVFFDVTHKPPATIEWE